MGKLTHIDDDSDEMAAAQELIAAQRQDAEPAPEPEPQAAQEAETPKQAAAAAQKWHDTHGPSDQKQHSDTHDSSRHGGFQRAPQGRAAMTAQEEEDFHGLGSGDSMGVGQGVLIVVAIVVFVAAILYILNSWIHFI
ncbi:MAG: hypothetical protein ACI362_03955 [Coriobacteriales bacterium]